MDVEKILQKEKERREGTTKEIIYKYGRDWAEWFLEAWKKMQRRYGVKDDH